MTRLTKATLLVAISFGFNKVLAILRQLIIARQFGLSAELDVFNVANNVPDLLYALISGGALAMAIIPVLSEVLTKQGREAAWKVLSQIANFAFIATTGFSILVAVFAVPLVNSQLGIAPGFTASQQALVVELMRLNLIGTLIFSIAGLLIAGLQANKHFLLPALAPILYNLGQIFGAVVLAPANGIKVLGLTLPAFGLGIHGLVYGVLIGSALFFLIQIPGLIVYQFKWLPRIDLKDPDVYKILVMLGPRVAGMLFYQLTFIARDNIASHLAQGAVTALTYGWMIQQVPETLIGTALGTTLLPTISEQFARHELSQFKNTLQRSVQVIIALALPSAILLSAALPPLLAIAFGWDTAGTQTLLWVTRAFLFGLVGHCLIEVASRAFYAQQNALIPSIASAINLGLYVLFGIIFSKFLQAPGLGLADSFAFGAQSIFLIFMLVWFMSRKVEGKNSIKQALKTLFNQSAVNLTLLRTLSGSLLGGAVILLVQPLLSRYVSPALAGVFALLVGTAITLPFIWKELRIFLHL
jgi:putative peptidoglycan lipid II flippase